MGFRFIVYCFGDSSSILFYFYLILVCKVSSYTAIIEDSSSFLWIRPLFVFWFHPQCLLQGFVLDFIFFLWLSHFIQEFCDRIRPTLLLLRICPQLYGFVHCFYAVVLSALYWRIHLPSFIGELSPLLLCGFVHFYCLFYFRITRKLLRPDPVPDRLSFVIYEQKK